jgi:hypothetical protein
MAVGTYNDGFVLTYQDGNPEYNHSTDLRKPIPVAEVIKIFQSYARNEDWGQSNFKWERFELLEKSSKVIKRLLIIAIVGFLAFILLKRFLEK